MVSPNSAHERATYAYFLDCLRAILAGKCAGLTPEQLATRGVAPSSLSLLGLIRHMADVEHSWFHRILRGNGGPHLFGGPDAPDVDFDGAVGTAECVEEAFAAWHRQVAFAQEWFDGLVDEDLDTEVPHHAEVVSVRGVIVHLIEEYARHCGHADLLRERLDGRTGD